MLRKLPRGGSKTSYLSRLVNFSTGFLGAKEHSGALGISAWTRNPLAVSTWFLSVPRALWSAPRAHQIPCLLSPAPETSPRITIPWMLQRFSGPRRDCRISPLLITGNRERQNIVHNYHWDPINWLIISFTSRSCIQVTSMVDLKCGILLNQPQK
jgi:hypothetical protein